MPSDRLTLLTRYHEEDPEDAFTRFALAQEYIKLGDTKQARHFFEQLVVTNPSYIGTYYHLGKLYESLGDCERAIATYRRGIDMSRQVNDFHARSELQSALLEAQGLGFDEDSA